jgi:hypothetical protein
VLVNGVGERGRNRSEPSYLARRTLLLHFASALDSI